MNRQIVNGRKVGRPKARLGHERSGEQRWTWSQIDQRRSSRKGLGSSTTRPTNLPSQLPIRAVIRPRQSDRRHLPCANLAHDSLPHIRILADLLRDDRVERETARRETGVVTRHAISRDERAMYGGWRRRGRSRLRVDVKRGAAGREPACEADRNRHGPCVDHALPAQIIRAGSATFNTHWLRS